MLMAQLRGKLSSEVWLGSEDLLTSAVLGTLKNLPTALTVDLLSRARPLEGSGTPALAPPLTWSFWPAWDRCEPDVVVEDERTVCIVEAKLYSDFGEDVGAGRQLQREWSDGLHYARAQGKELWLLALTNHAAMPAEGMRTQLAHSRADLSRVGWLSWLEVGRLLRSAEGEAVAGWCEDVLELLQRMGLAPCEGFRELLQLAVALPSAAAPWAVALSWRSEPVTAAGFGQAVRMARKALPAGLPWTRPLPLAGRASSKVGS